MFTLVGGQYLMEGLKFGWVRPVRKDICHYIEDFSHVVTGNVNSLCNEYHIKAHHGRNKEFLEKYEILDTSTICHVCELKLKQLEQNNSKKEILDEINNTSVSYGYVLRNVVCSDENCNEKGITFVSITDEEKPHYCIKHNLRVQETIRKEKKLEIIQ